MKIFTSDDPEYVEYVGMFNDYHLIDNNSLAMRIMKPIMNLFWFCAGVAFFSLFLIPLFLIIAYPFVCIWGQ